MITKLFEKSLETLKQRGADNAYDKGSFENGERSGAQIARVYNAITGQNISEADAWTFLQCLKLVRMENQMRTGQGDLLDTAVDLLSYTALKSEAVLNEHRPAQVAQLVAGDVRDNTPAAEYASMCGESVVFDTDNASPNAGDGHDGATLKGCAARFSGCEPLGGFPGAIPAATGFMKDPGVFISSGLSKIETGNHAVLSEDENESTRKC